MSTVAIAAGLLLLVVAVFLAILRSTSPQSIPPGLSASRADDLPSDTLDTGDVRVTGSEITIDFRRVDGKRLLAKVHPVHAHAISTALLRASAAARLSERDRPTKDADLS